MNDNTTTNATPLYYLIAVLFFLAAMAMNYVGFFQCFALLADFRNQSPLLYSNLQLVNGFCITALILFILFIVYFAVSSFFVRSRKFNLCCCLFAVVILLGFLPSCFCFLSFRQYTMPAKSILRSTLREWYSADHAPYTDPWKLVYLPWYEQYNKKNIPAWGNKKEASKETDMKDPSSASLPQN